MFSNSAESSSSLGEDRQFIEWPKACHQKSDNCDENTMTTRVISSVELHMGRAFSARRSMPHRRHLVNYGTSMDTRGTQATCVLGLYCVHMHMVCPPPILLWQPRACSNIFTFKKSAEQVVWRPDSAVLMRQSHGIRVFSNGRHG